VKSIDEAFAHRDLIKVKFVEFKEEKKRSRWSCGKNQEPIDSSGWNVAVFGGVPERIRGSRRTRLPTAATAACKRRLILKTRFLTCSGACSSRFALSAFEAFSF